MPFDIFTRYYNPNNLGIWKLILNMQPGYHYAKVIQNIYDITGSEDGKRSFRQQHERYSELPGNTTCMTYPLKNYYYLDMFAQPVGYNKYHGFPSRGLTTTVPIDVENLIPLNWTITLRQPELTRINSESQHWEALNFEDGIWVDKGKEWYAPSGLWSCFILWLLCPFWLVLAWYGAQVFSVGEGRALPWYFFLKKSYWFRSSHDKMQRSRGETNDSEMQENQKFVVKNIDKRAARYNFDISDKIEQARKRSTDLCSIICLKLSKSYNDQTALRELTLEMDYGKVFCLLGQNGAGKTTTINLLTGLHAPT